MRYFRENTNMNDGLLAFAMYIDMIKNFDYVDLVIFIDKLCSYKV